MLVNSKRKGISYLNKQNTNYGGDMVVFKPNYLLLVRQLNNSNSVAILPPSLLKALLFMGRGYVNWRGMLKFPRESR